MIKKYVNKVEINDQEDMKQEILMKIHKICLSFKIDYNYLLEDNGKQFTKYIQKTIQNIYYDYLRKQKDKIETLMDDIIMVDNNYLENSIKNKQSKFIELINHYSEKEVAKILGISQQAVNKRKHKIYQKLKK